MTHLTMKERIRVAKIKLLLIAVIMVTVRLYSGSWLP